MKKNTAKNNAMKLYLKTLTPLHIGTGTELEPIDYVVVDNHYYRFSQNFLNNFLAAQHLFPLYEEWMNQLLKALDVEKNNKRQSEIRQQYNLLAFCKKNKKEHKLIEALKNPSGIIKVPLKEEKPNRKVRAQITNGTLIPYIPGSSIKGALRTALLYQWLKQYGDTTTVKEILLEELKVIDQNNFKEKAKTFASKIENMAFYCGTERRKNEKSEIDYTDEKFDLLKLLMVSDARIVSPHNPLTLIKTNLYLDNGTVQSQSPWIEAIAPGCIAEFTLDFNIHFLYALKNKLHNDCIIVDETRIWIGMGTKVQELFGIDISSLTENNLEEMRKQAINQILLATSQFSKKQKEENEKWKSKIKSSKRPNQKNEQTFKVSQIDFSIIPELHALNLGFASGFMGITELLYLLENDALKETFKEVMKKFSLGAFPHKKRTPVKNAKQYQPNPDRFPKSRTMCQYNNKIVPIGWALITDNYNAGQQPDQHTESSLQIPSPARPAQTAYTLQYYTGRLKAGAEVDALYHGVDELNPDIKCFKLFIEAEGKEQIVRCKYHSEIPEGTYFKVRISSVQKDKIQSIQIVKEIK